MGLAMILAALVPKWRVPVLLYSSLEKALMVWLVLSNGQNSFVSGFWIPCALESTVVIYPRARKSLLPPGQAGRRAVPGIEDSS